jgi:simple sugar transport system ATP-binding protein/D-xylose transport system ATP-binding protein
LKILAGIHQPDSGELRINGMQTGMRDASEAHRHGIAVVHQDLALVECLDIATNMALGAIPRRGRFLLDRARMEREAADVLAELKIRVGSVRTQIGLLSGGERQIVAIARAVRMNLPIILLDEPTAALGVRETAHVGEILEELRNQGKTVICISHDLEFVFAHADRITVMRLGNTVATRLRSETSRDEIVGMITGTIGTSSRGRAGVS